MRKVGAFEAKTHFGQLLTEVEATNQEIVIQRRGKDVAVLAPCHRRRLTPEQKKWILDGLREIRAAARPARPGETGEALVEEGRER